ncbi:ankyrin repeat domain-containing protein 26-like isoform X2 [Myotis yumanensis]|uniref:ankyrin repeat domain-containing protein 26-like isoform X2 n=1 Tax=Myotis yumanensis TaxID=159337 RepID=UPI0038D05A7D
MNSDMSNLKYNNEILSQQLSKLESKSNNLEIELHHTRDALKERTLDLERDLIQKQCQKEEIEHTCQKEQGKVDKDIGKQESLQEKLSHLQSENMLLRQQLDQAHNKADREEKTAINIQHQIQDKISIFNAECVKQIHMLNERINELINEWQLFKERIHQYENDHVEKNVPESSEKEESLLIENCILWDENAKLRLEINTAKNQKQEMEKEDVEDLALVKEKLDHLQKTIRETVFQHNEQLEVLRVENTVLNSKLEDEQQNRGRLEAEVESYRSRLATAVQDHEHCQTSKGDLQLASQTARDEGFCAGRSFYKPVEVEEKKEQKVSKRETSRNMYDGADDSDSGGLSQQSNSEQTDKHQVSIMENEESDRFTLREEKEKRLKADLLYEKNRVQLRKKEEHSIKEVEMNPQLETTIRTQNITLDIITENEVPESSEKEESLLHENCMLRDENAKLRLEIDTAKNQKQEMEKEHFEDIAIVNKKNDHLQKTIRETVFPHNEQLEVLRVENTVLNSKLEDEQQNRGRLEAEDESYRSRPATAAQDLEHCQTSKGDLQLASQTARDEGFCAGRSLYKPVENDELIAKLQPSSSKCICLDEEKTPQQELSMEPLLKRREELKDRVKKAKQEAVNLRNIEKNMVEICELEDYKKKLEERAIRDVADKVEKVNSLLQRQRASQKMSEQMINDQASTSHLELRNKELESEISKVQTSQDDIERELKKYVRLYQEELEGRKLLENQLTDFPRIKEKLAEVSNKLFWEKQLSKRNSIPRENLGIPTSNPCTSTYHRMQTLSSASISMTTRVRLPLDLQRWEQGHQGSPRAPSGFLEDTRHRLFPNEGLCSRYGRSMEKP